MKTSSLTTPKNQSDEKLTLERLVKAFDRDLGRNRLSGVSAFASSAQREAFEKKYVGDGSVLTDAQRHQAAEDLFISTSDRTREHNRRLKHDLKDLDNIAPDVAMAITFAKEALLKGFEEGPSTASLWRHFSHGPGATANPNKWEVDESWFSKTLENTRGASNDMVRRYANRFIAGHPQWAQAEEARCLWCEANGKPAYIINQKAIFFSVPKNAKINRGCVKEPTDNMATQKAAGGSIQDILATHYLLDITKQDDVNQRLAQIGSQDGTFATIDSKSFSDTISPNMVHHLLGHKWFSFLSGLRSPVVVLGNGAEYALGMFSTMGNGFTFPMQTALCTGIVHGVYRALGLPLYDLSLISKTGSPKRFGVFGDDIIVLEEAYDLVVAVLEFFGCVVNDLKSFRGESEFRESCGADYFRGHNVRPVFCESLRRVTDRFSLFNRLAVWGASHSIDLPETLGLLLDSIPVRLRYPIPGWEAVDGGVVVPDKFIGSKYLAPTVSKVTPENAESVLRFLNVGVPEYQRSFGYVGGYTFKSHTHRVKRVTKVVSVVNYAGIAVTEFPSSTLTALLGQYITEDGTVTLRSHDTGSDTVKRYTPSWSVTNVAVNAWDQPLQGFTRSFYSYAERRYDPAWASYYQDYLTRFFQRWITSKQLDPRRRVVFDR